MNKNMEEKTEELYENVRKWFSEIIYKHIICPHYSYKYNGNVYCMLIMNAFHRTFDDVFKEIKENLINHYKNLDNIDFIDYEQ